ncbi:tail fiber/spike domain-containing protein [Escherichia coli]
MTTYNTRNPLGSSAAKDLYDNAQNLDHLSNDLINEKWKDRFGVDRLTWHGIEALSKRAMSSYGYITLDCFEDGNTLTLPNQVLRLEATGEYYRWDGSLPKTVPAGSTPETSGGIGLGAWLSVGDATVRGWVKSNTGLSDTVDELIANLNTVGAGVIHGTHEVPPSGMMIPPLSHLSATGQSIAFIGEQFQSSGYFHKTGNATVELSNQDPNAPSATVDTILYIDPEWIETEAYPQKTVIENIAVLGDEDTHNECGIYILQGGGYSLKNIDAHHVSYGLRMGDVWLTTVDKFHTMGAIRQDLGTSTTYINCWAKGLSDLRGAHHYENVSYSNWIGCASDGALNGAYYFKSTTGVLNGCGAEASTVSTGNTGLALTIDSGNKLTINNFQYRPLTTDTIALITVGDNNALTINRFNSNVGVAYQSPDIYVYGNDSVITVNSSRFRAGRSSPIIHIAPGSTSMVIVNMDNGNKAIYTSGATSTAPLVEYMFDSGTFSPTVQIGGSTVGITYLARSGSWVKNGNTITAHVSVSLSSKGTNVGGVSVAALPFVVPENTGGILISYSGISAGPICVGTSTQSNSMLIRRMANTATVTLSNAEIDNSFSISFTYTCRASSMFD